MEIVRLPLDYAGSFEEVVDYNRFYTLGTLTVTARLERFLIVVFVLVSNFSDERRACHVQWRRYL